VTAQYQFLPWVREGAATAYTNADNLKAVLTAPAGKALSRVPTVLTLNGQTKVDVALRLYGPGDVTGIDPRVVIRVEPPAGTADLEPNYLAAIEFDSPAFPWLFTPAAAAANGRLRPWLVLVVLRRTEAARLRRMPGVALPVVNAPVNELPDLLESWAWAHAQAFQADASDPVEPILAERPHQNLSRLLCPRRLEPRTRYTACVVPAFEAGRKAGLGLAVTAADEDRLAPAWDATRDAVQLPVYYVWEFATGAGGYFERLASKITSRRLEARIGRRPLRVQDQPFGLPDLPGRQFEGALLATAPGPLPALDPPFAQALQALLNLGEEAAQPVVAPPVHGSWQAARTSVPGAGESPVWLRELNLEPSLRAVAGLGARVVQRRQDQLMAAAWEQLGDARAVSRFERRMEFAVAVLDSVVRRRVEPLATGHLVQLLGPAQSRMRTSPQTLRARLAAEGLPPSMSSAPLRRSLRPAGTLVRRRPTAVSLVRVVTRVATAVPAAGPRAGAPGLVTDQLVAAHAGRLPGGTTGAANRYFTAVRDLQVYLGRFTGQAPPAPRPPFAFGAALKAELVAHLEPRASVTPRFQARIETAEVAGLGPSAGGRVRFPQPMYEALRDLSPELLLPGVGSIDDDTVTVLHSNPRFIEAFMVGLNHELASELLWREFPSDLRATYFTNFWDTRAEPQPIAQLPPIHSWSPSAGLGQSFSAGGAQLLLLIRGELLQRYPDALIYAVKARTASQLGDEERFPLFRGRIEPDITFLGFALSATEVRAAPGWFFVIQEQPSAPRFGLDDTRSGALASWNDLAWTDTRTVPGAHLRLADLKTPAAQRPAGPEWAFNAAHMAAILRQRPVQLAFHGTRMVTPS
jgi:hypothetical protein